MNVRITLDQDKIVEFCQRWKITEFALFGSVLRNDFRSDSDVDVLVTFAPNAHWTLFDMVHIQNELQEIMGRKVDLVSRRGIEASRNYLRRKAILSSAEVVHVARSAIFPRHLRGGKACPELCGRKSPRGIPSGHPLLGRHHSPLGNHWRSRSPALT